MIALLIRICAVTGKRTLFYISGQKAHRTLALPLANLHGGGEVDVAREDYQSLTHFVMRDMGAVLTLHNSMLTARQAPERSTV